MKAEIKADGYIHITAETVTEAFAMMHMQKQNEKQDLLFVIDWSVIDGQEQGSWKIVDKDLTCIK